MVPRIQWADNEASIAQRIDAGRSRMPSAMARVANVVEQYPTAPLDLSISALAERAGTSAASVTRFCRLIGFEGYTQFRVRVASEAGSESVRPSPARHPQRDLAPDDPPEVLQQMLLEGHIRALEATVHSVDLDAVTRTVDAISGCEHLDVYGVGSSGFLAELMQSRLYRIGVKAHAWTSLHDGVASAAVLNRRSVAVGISSTGYTSDTVQMLNQAARAGAYTVAITHDDRSPIAKIADSTIATTAHSSALQPDNLSVKHSQLFIVDLLYLLIAQNDVDVASTRLDAAARAVAPHRRAPRPFRPIRQFQESR